MAHFIASLRARSGSCEGWRTVRLAQLPGYSIACWGACPEVEPQPGREVAGGELAGFAAPATGLGSSDGSLTATVLKIAKVVIYGR
jgi:hypothetical protein